MCIRATWAENITIVCRASIRPWRGLSGGATTSENHLAAFPEAEPSHVSFAAILPLVDTPQGCAGVYTKRHAHIHVCVT